MMEKEQFEEIRQFSRTLTEKRQVMADGALLDWCQQHLNALVEHLAAEFEEHPHINDEADEAAAPERPPIVEASRAEPEPEPPPPAPVHSEPKHDVRHVVQHKRPTPRKTHR